MRCDCQHWGTCLLFWSVSSNHNSFNTRWCGLSLENRKRWRRTNNWWSKVYSWRHNDRPDRLRKWGIKGRPNMYIYTFIMVNYEHIHLHSHILLLLKYDMMFSVTVTFLTFYLLHLLQILICFCSHTLWLYT